MFFLTLVGISWREAVRTFIFRTSGSTFDRLVATLESLGSSVAFPLGLLGVIYLFSCAGESAEHCFLKDGKIVILGDRAAGSIAAANS